MKSLKSILVAVSLFISIIGFAANVIPNNEGVNLYYNFNDELKLATLQPSEGDAYKGVINIPEQITFEGTTYDVATIATGAFKDCKDLTEVSIPKTITKIGGHAFKGCDNLRTVNYNANNCVSAADIKGKSVSSAFEDCKSITTVNFGGDVVIIPEYLFWGCTGLTEITIPENVQQIGGAAFIDCSAISKITINAIKCIRMSSDNNRPAFVGAPITTVEFGPLATTIPDYAFYGCKTLTSVTIPENITAIGGAAFQNCPALTTVIFNASNCTVAHTILGDNVTPAFNNPAITRVEFGAEVRNIPNYIFWGCKGITDIVFGDNIETIGLSAFYGCTSLNNIVIPEGVTSIGGRAFANCKSLNTITFNAVNCVNMVTMENNVPMPAFENNALSAVNFGNRVEVIPDYAFANCPNLKTFAIPASVRHIGYKAFFGCKSLQAVTIPEGVTSIGGLAFAECNGLVDVAFNATRCTGASKIENGQTLSAFHNSKSIKNVTIGADVEILPDYLLLGCSSLNTINIPQKIRTIGENTFAGCINLTTINYDAERCEETLAFNGCAVVNLTIGNHVKSIPNFTFSDCGRLNDFILPATVENIGKYAFKGCANIKKVTLPEGLKTIEGGAFEDCGNLREVYFNAIDCKAIVEYDDTTDIIPVFHSSSIRKVFLGTKVEAIPDYMFYRCYDIEDVTFNKTLKYIGKYAFYEARSLRYIYLPETLETLGGASFGECELLATIDFDAINCTSASTIEGDSILYPFIGENDIYTINIGKKVTSLPEGIFFNSQYLTEVAITRNITSLGGLAFGNCPMLTKVYFDATECPNAHSTINQKIAGLNDDTQITTHNSNYGPFEGCNDLEEASISAKINTLPDYLFSGCAGLRKIELPEKVTRIGDYAFKGCLALKKIIIPETVETIGDGAFMNSGLTSVSIHEFLSEIGEGAFDGCKSLAKITLKKKNKYYTMVGTSLYTADKSTLVAKPGGR
jgi:hypothetical protein